MTIETKKVASANEAIEIINRLNYRHDTFCYTSTTREDNADIKYRHFDAYRQNGEKDSFAITEIVVNGKLEVVRFFNLFRDITVDLKLGDFNPDYSRYEVINVDAENEPKTVEVENESAKENDSKMIIEISGNNDELVNQLKTFSAKVRGLSCEEFLAENAGLSIAEYREKKATAENRIAKLEIEFKIEDIKSEIGRLENENYYTARNLYGIVVLEKHYATDESLQAYAAELVDEFNERLGKINEAQAELATLAPATADAERGNEPTAAEDKWNDTDKGAILKDKIERDSKPSVESIPAYIPAEDTDDDDELIDLPADNNTVTDTTPEYKYYIKSRRPIFGAAPNRYIKAVSGEVHEPVRRTNGTYSPKCRIYFATVIYDKPLTDEQILNYDLAVSNETFELLNAPPAQNEMSTISNIAETDGSEDDDFADEMPALFLAEDTDDDDELIDPPVDNKITPDEMLAIIDTLDTVNAAAPYGWQIEFDGKNFPIEFNGKLVTTLDSLALAKALPPERFFEQFAPDVSPKERYINDRHKELDMLLDFRKFVEDDPDRLNTLANLIEDVKREILNAELDTEHPPDIEYDEHGEVIPWF